MAIDQVRSYNYQQNPYVLTCSYGQDPFSGPTNQGSIYDNLPNYNNQTTLPGVVQQPQQQEEIPVEEEKKEGGSFWNDIIVGAGAGAAIGAWGAGVGAIPGAIIGGGVALVKNILGWIF